MKVIVGEHSPDYEYYTADEAYHDSHVAELPRKTETEKKPTSWVGFYCRYSLKELKRLRKKYRREYNFEREIYMDYTKEFHDPKSKYSEHSQDYNKALGHKLKAMIKYRVVIKNINKAITYAVQTREKSA